MTKRRKTATLNEEQGEVLSVGKDKTSNDVWRAERRCQGGDVHMVKLAMEFHSQWREG